MPRHTYLTYLLGALAALTAVAEANAITLGVTVVENGPPGSRSLIVREVAPKSVAARMGVEPGAVIVRVNDTKVQSIAECKKALDAYSVTLIWKIGAKFYRSTAHETAVFKQVLLSPDGKEIPRNTDPAIELDPDGVTPRELLDVQEEGALSALIDRERAAEAAERAAEARRREAEAHTGRAVDRDNATPPVVRPETIPSGPGRSLPAKLILLMIIPLGVAVIALLAWRLGRGAN
jgi:membrane-associated protease RseP (regulator of RpoE activity)